MERNFKLKQGYGVTIKIYRNPDYGSMRIGESVVYPDGNSGFVLRGESLEGELGPFVVPQKTVEEGGVCKGPEDGVVWEFPTLRTYDEFSFLAWRAEKMRSREGKVKSALNRFNLKRLVSRIKGML